jgi:hypothetical protein
MRDSLVVIAIGVQRPSAAAPVGAEVEEESGVMRDPSVCADPGDPLVRGAFARENRRFLSTAVPLSGDNSRNRDDFRLLIKACLLHCNTSVYKYDNIPTLGLSERIYRHARAHDHSRS